MGNELWTFQTNVRGWAGAGGAASEPRTATRATVTTPAVSQVRGFIFPSFKGDRSVADVIAPNEVSAGHALVRGEWGWASFGP
jgi:hypothetical protein